MKKLNLLVVCLLVLFSCKNNELNLQQNSKSKELDTSSLKSRNFVISDGYIRTSENFAIANATVSKGGQVIGTTNSDGYFRISGASVGTGDVLTFEHPRYVTVTKMLKANSQLLVWMKERAPSVTIDSRAGGNIRLERGGNLRISGNAFALDNRLYRGPVEITATYIDVTNRDEVRSAPGSYIAFDAANNSLVPLTSYGMVEILAVVPQSNRPLDLRKATPIQATLPILTSDSPSTVNLYELDSSTGYWTLSGQLNNVQNTLQGEITGVNGSWNADEPCSEDLVCVKVQVAYEYGNPDCGVGVEGVTYQGSDGPYLTDANGYVEFMVCPNSVIELGACWIYCCQPGTPPSDPCCNNPQHRTTIDLSTVTMNPNGCTDLGTWLIDNF